MTEGYLLEKRVVLTANPSCRGQQHAHLLLPPEHDLEQLSTRRSRATESTKTSTGIVHSRLRNIRWSPRSTAMLPTSPLRHLSLSN
eukprot:5542786-Pyramimonas_sp.AAC.1